MKNIFTCFVFFIFFNVVPAQQSQILLRIDEKPISKNEFERIFEKNLDLVQDQDKKNIEDYLQLFIDYKLKVLEAEAEGLDTVQSFRGQFRIYKSQLAQKYMLDTKVTDHLLHQAYDRLQQEINASHILVRVAPDASPQDTLKAYKKIEDIRKKIENGTSFEKLAVQYSEDPSVKSNKGHLGWFGVFTMIYPFENAAYNTKVGQISEPVRTRFGYHLVKVNDKRKAEGKVSVAQILVKPENGSGGEEAKKRIEKIYQKLQQGLDFADMAKQYSDDKSTASNGGKMKPFKRGALKSPEFEVKAFGLTKENPLSKPFKTKFGWHIVKLLHRYPVESFAEEKKGLEKRIRKDQRSQVIRDSVIKKLKNKYTVVESRPGLEFFKNNRNDLSNEKTAEKLPDKKFMAIKGDSATYGDFLDVIRNYEKRHHQKTISEKSLDNLYADFKDDFLFKYQKKHLAEINLDYAHAVQDYRDGLLIFALMKKNIWDKAKSDTLGLKRYYANHKNAFRTPPRYDLLIASADSKKLAKSVRREMKQDKSEKVLKKDFSKIIIVSGEYTEDDQRLPKNFKRKPGVSNISKHHGLFVVVKTRKINPAHQNTYKEAKGAVINAYQDALKKEYIQHLRSQHQIDINRNVVNTLKSKFEQ